MFGGIDEVDWAALGHAYGPADDVPELLRGLASGDPVEREAALDGMYGAVHHQGDVYDSTLACIPFLLELVADPAVQDRGGIVELLTSIGGIDLDGDDELDPEDEEFEFAANYAMAASAVTAGSDVFLALIDSPDRGVRLTVPLALATLHSEPDLVLRLLRERLEAERDPEVRFACVEAAGRIALRHSWLAAEVVDWLVELARVRYGAGAGTPAEPRRAAGPEHGGAVVRRHSLRRDPWDDPPHPADHGSDFDTEVWGTEVWGTDGFGVDGPGPEVPWADGFGRPDPWPAPGRVEFPGPWDDPVPPDGPVFPGGAVPPDGPPGTPPAARPTLNGLPSPPGSRDGSTAPAVCSAPGSSHDSTRGDDLAADPVRGNGRRLSGRARGEVPGSFCR
ncbi:hypothetical protein SSCG_00181 [Streptomyces clavuligerus]|nr:hypothetical protein SSCG_00181 [Streptomyces clavuligerus]